MEGATDSISVKTPESFTAKLRKWGTIIGIWAVLIISVPILNELQIKVSLPLLISITVLITASMLGLKGGLIAGILATPINLLLHYVFHSTINDLNILQILVSIFSFCLAGGIAGRLHDMRERLSTELTFMDQEIVLRKEVEEALRESEKNYRNLFELESDAIFIIRNSDGAILEVNSVACDMYGYNHDELLTMKNTDLSAEPEETRAKTKAALPADQVVKIPMRWHRKLDGTVFPVDITARFIQWHGISVHIAAIRDITERHKFEQELEQLATTDPLTGLFNRRQFFKKAHEVFTRSHNEPYELSLLMIDIDHFKDVNDNYGHAIGDVTLREVANRLRESTRPTDVIGRYGGEEFVIILPRTDMDETRRIAGRLCESVAREPVCVEQFKVSVTVSVGIAALNETIPSLDELLKHADQALYVAKEAGRNRWAEFES